MSKIALRTSSGDSSRCPGVLATALATAERMHAGEEHDDGLSLLRVSSVSGAAVAHKFDAAHLFADHEGSLVPAKQRPRNEQRKCSRISKHDQTHSRAILQPLWAILRSPEVRAAQLSGTTLLFCAGSDQTPPRYVQMHHAAPVLTRYQSATSSCGR